MLGQILDRIRHTARKRSMSPDLVQGRRGEDLTHRYLRRHGFTIVARNYRLPSGDAEVDLIAWEGQGDEKALVFVEVKTRESAAYGPPDRAVGPEKQRHIIRVAREYTRRTDTPWTRVRFDLVGVVMQPRPDITLFRNAFSARG